MVKGFNVRGLQPLSFPNQMEALPDGDGENPDILKAVGRVGPDFTTAE